MGARVCACIRACVRIYVHVCVYSLCVCVYTYACVCDVSTDSVFVSGQKQEEHRFIW